MSIAASVVPHEELVRSIHSATNRQVWGLRVELMDNEITITGNSRTFYVKQLVTQAVRSCLPSMRLQNEICVCMN